MFIIIIIILSVYVWVKGAKGMVHIIAKADGFYHGKRKKKHTQRGDNSKAMEFSLLFCYLLKTATMQQKISWCVSF